MRTKRRENIVMDICIAAAFCVIAVVIIFTIIMPVFAFNDKKYSVTVVKVERENYSDPGKHLIYCETDDGESVVFENVNEILRAKFNSAELQAEIREGGHYVFTVVGARIPFLDFYQNIIKVEGGGE